MLHALSLRRPIVATPARWRGQRLLRIPCALVVALASAMVPLACQSAPRSPVATRDAPASGGARPLRASVAMIDGQPVAPEEIWPTMAELSGGEALQDLLLDRLIRAELVRRGLAVDSAADERERALLLGSLSEDRLEATRLLETLRERQRLGPVRFNALLRRTAALRALVATEVEISDSALRLAHELATAPRRQVRIGVFPSLAACDEALARLRAGESFAEIVTELSTDASAARGGLLEPIAAADASWPESLRGAIFGLRPGETSAPVLLDQGYAVAMLVRELPPTGRSFDAMRPELERTVRLAQERVLMDQLARRLRREAQVTVFDDALQYAWQRR